MTTPPAPTSQPTPAAPHRPRAPGVFHVRAVGPDDWKPNADRPVPVRLVRTVQSGIGLGFGIAIAQLLILVPVLLLFGATLFGS